MPERIGTQFDNQLFGLFQARTHVLRASVWPSAVLECVSQNKKCDAQLTGLMG
jgi:hypothetical protein